MNRFLIFAGSHYYPSGGWDDFIGSSNTLDFQDVMNLVADLVPDSYKRQWVQVRDTQDENPKSNYWWNANHGKPEFFYEKD